VLNDFLKNKTSKQAFKHVKTPQKRIPQTDVESQTGQKTLTTIGPSPSDRHAPRALSPIRPLDSSPAAFDRAPQGRHPPPNPKPGGSNENA
jgi:hypothetical protein